jgi:hypothetical protein
MSPNLDFMQNLEKWSLTMLRTVFSKLLNTSYLNYKLFERLYDDLNLNERCSSN